MSNQDKVTMRLEGCGFDSVSTFPDYACEDGVIVVMQKRVNRFGTEQVEVDAAGLVNGLDVETYLSTQRA